jgi:hypothetical protein
VAAVSRGTSTGRVLRPLPQSIIGRTYLVPYPSDGGRRHFPTLSVNPANLLGLSLSVETLPFQEQDQVTAACATSALWSAFQATGRLFQHRLPSPVEITSSATSRMPLRSRAFPNTDGLTIEQTAHAIREAGLEPYYVAGHSEEVFRSAVYTYLAAGIPPLVVIALTGEQAGKRQFIGRHAVTVTGYSLPGEARQFTARDFHLTSDSIDKLYVHDDQVGPHARMELKDPTTKEWHLSTSWGLGGAYADIRTHPIAVLLPLYNKIRIPFTAPLEDLMSFDAALRALQLPWLIEPPTWNLRLTTVNRLKEAAYVARH